MARNQTSVEEIKNIFNKFDKNGDGKISVDELTGILRSLGSQTASAEEVRLIMEEIDKDGDGYIDINEFSDFYCSETSGSTETSELKDAFDMYDLDKNGLISVKELHNVMNRLGMKCSLADCNRMISNLDRDGDGSLNFDEFKRMMKSSRG